MKHLGRKIRQIDLTASAEALLRATKFNDEMHLLPTGGTTYIPKGVYHFPNHEAANERWNRCVAEGIAKIGADRKDE